MRAMVVCDDREVMRLGLVEMLQAMQLGDRPEGLQFASRRVDLPRRQPRPQRRSRSSAALLRPRSWRRAGRPVETTHPDRADVARQRGGASGRRGRPARRWVTSSKRTSPSRCSGRFSPGSMSASSRCRLRWPSSCSDRSAAPRPAPRPAQRRVSRPCSADRRRRDQQDDRRRARDLRPRGQAPRSQPSQAARLLEPDRGCLHRHAARPRRDRS